MYNLELPFWGLVKQITLGTKQEMSICSDVLDAINTVILTAQETISGLHTKLGMDRAQLSKSLNRKGYNFPANKLSTLISATKSFLPLQKLMEQLGLGGYLEAILKLKAAGVKPHHLEALEKIISNGHGDMIEKLAA